MTRLTYAQQLAHPNWQRRRLEMLSAANWKCTCCSDAETQLHVHHRQYFKGRMAWEYSETELVVLCNNCHENEHYDDEQLKRLLTLVPISQGPIFNAFAILAGYFGQDVGAINDLADEVGVYRRLQVIGTIAADMRNIPEERLEEVAAFVRSMEPAYAEKVTHQALPGATDGR